MEKCTWKVARRDGYVSADDHFCYRIGTKEHLGTCLLAISDHFSMAVSPSLSYGVTRYFSCRTLEIDVMADRASVLRFLVVYNPVAGYLQRWRQQLDSRAWVAKLTAETLERNASETPGGYVDVDEVACSPSSFCSPARRDGG